MIRIISGKWRGKQIVAPKNLPVRPTTDRAKESFFNWLQFRLNLEECSVLDLFSGTGNITYEFISRGASYGLAIDADAACIRFIDKTIRQLNADDAFEVLQMEVLNALKQMNQKFDLIFADPPYDFQQYDELIDLIFSKGLINNKGWFVLEHAKDHDFSGREGFVECRKYGKVHFSYFSDSKE